MKSVNFVKIKDYYDSGLWDKNRVYNVVGKSNGITKEEFKEITGDMYF